MSSHAKKSVLDLVSEAYNAVWSPEEQQQLLNSGQNGATNKGDRSGAYVAHTVLPAISRPTRTLPTSTSAAEAANSPSPPEANDSISLAASGDDAPTASEAREKNDVEDDKEQEVEASVEGSGSVTGSPRQHSIADAPPNAQTQDKDAESAPASSPIVSSPHATSPMRDCSDGEKLQMLNQKAEELERISRMIADKVQISLAVKTTSGDVAGSDGSTGLGPRARGMLQKTSPKRRKNGDGSRKRMNGKVDARFSSNPLGKKLSPSRGGNARGRGRLNPVQGATRKKKKKKKQIWEPKEVGGSYSNDDTEDTSNGGGGDSGMSPTPRAQPILPFTTSSSVISRGPGRRSRTEVIQSVREGKDRLRKKQMGRRPWNRVEAEARALIEEKKQQEIARKKAKKKAAAIATARLKTISVGQWLQTLRLEHYYESFLEEGYETVHDLLELTETEFHMLLKLVGIRKMKRRATMHRKLRAFLGAVLESAAAANPKKLKAEQSDDDDEDSSRPPSGSLPAINGDDQRQRRRSRKDSDDEGSDKHNSDEFSLPDIRAMTASGSTKD